MTEPIIFISRNRILGAPGRFATAYAQAVELIGSTKPGTALFAAYLDETRTQVAVVHAFPDAVAMAHHFEGSEDRTSGASAMIAPDGFEVYGPAPSTAIDQLRREAESAGVALAVFPESIGGFLRSPS